MEQRIYGAIDIGGSFMKFGYGDPDDGILWHDKMPVTDKTLEGMYGSLEKAIRVIHDKAGRKVSAIAMGSPGTIDSDRGVVTGYSPNLPHWKGAAPAAFLKRIFGVPVFMENDANLMAYGEASRFDYQKSLLGITIGTGIGSGLVIGNQIYRGVNYMSMELGHTVVIPGGRLCKCGKHGCVEAYSSATAIVDRSVEVLSDVNDPAVNKINNLTVLQALKLAAVNERVNHVVGESVEFLALSIANAVTLLDIDVLLIGGGVADIDIYPFEKLREGILKFLLPEIRENLCIEKAKYGNQAALLGCVNLCAQRDLPTFPKE